MNETTEPAQLTDGMKDGVKDGMGDSGTGFVFWGGALLGLGLAILRITVLHEAMARSSFSTALRLLAQGLVQDFLIALGLTLVFAALVRAATGRRLRQALTLAFAVLAGLVLLAGLANLVALRMLGAPLTMEWVAYADMTHTDVVLDYMRRVLTGRVLFIGLASLVAFFGLSLLATRRMGGLGPALIGIAAMGLTVIAGTAMRSLETGVALARFQNPIVALVASAGQESGPKLLDGPATADAAPPFGPAPRLNRPPAPARPIRNVILFAFESTPANQAQGWGGPHPVTPRLAGILDRALAFDRAYAHVPASNYYLVSVFGALVPELSPISMMASRPNLDTIYLPEVMNANGFRTAFFNSSDNRFQNTEGLVRAAGFQKVGDYRDWHCETGVYEFASVTDKYLNTSSDLCTIEQITGWIEEQPEAPFFVSFRTGMTHYPYFPGENPKEYSDDDTYNDYLNALSVGDQAFGRLIDYLDATQRADETLIVVLGDHGEAFGQHGTYVHAAGINEENVHIPMALVNPQLFSGERSDLIVGIADIAPTITDLLGVATPSTWQGRSVFATGRRNGVLFFSPWNGFLVGYREGDQKFIYNGNTGESQFYDLARDPGEERNLVQSDPDAAAAARTKLAALVAAQNRYTDWLLAQSGAVALEAADRSQIEIEASGTSFRSPPEGWVMLDGKHVGGFKVSNAPSNADRAVARDEIAAAFSTFRLPVDASDCPRNIEVYFLNDEWAGEGKTGDTDLYVRSVRFAGTTYFFTRFRTLHAGTGGTSGDSYRFWRKGGARIDLDLDQSCLSAGLANEDGVLSPGPAGDR